VGVIGGGVAFLVEYDKGAVRCRFELGGGEGEVIRDVVGCGEIFFRVFKA
jgi:hypothetical protein